MSFKEVKELRKSGKLEEALELAQRDLENALIGNPSERILVDFNSGETKEIIENEVAPTQLLWAKRSIAWVYYDYLKKFAKPETFDEFMSYISALRELNLPVDEKMVFDNCAYQIGSLVFALTNDQSTNFNKLKQLFNQIRNFHFTKPSEAYSFLYKAFHKSYQHWDSYLDFADWWGFDNFRSEDFLLEEYNGRKIMSLTEQAGIAYSKKLLEGEISGEFLAEKTINRKRIKDFLPFLDELIEKHPSFQYPSYFKAKLLLALGSKENVLSAFLPFAKQKRNEFWVWEILAEIFANDPDIQFACYCKALSLSTKEDFLVKIRQHFSETLIQKQLFDEAKTEIEKIIETRTRENWKIPATIQSWTESSWYGNAKNLGNNQSLYRKHLSKAEEILFADTPEELVFVEFVNSDKSILNFIASEEKFGFFKFDRFLKKVQPGEVLSVRFNGGASGSRYNILTCRKVMDDYFKSQFQKEVDGIVKIRPGASFGFLGDAFVHPNTISKYKLEDGQNFKGQIIKTYDSKKEKWGWKLI